MQKYSPSFQLKGERIEIIIRTYNGKKLNEFKCDLSNVKRLNEIFKTLELKYNIFAEGALKKIADSEKGWFDY